MDQLIKDAEEWLRSVDVEPSKRNPKGYVRRDPQTNLIRALVAGLKQSLAYGRMG